MQLPDPFERIEESIPKRALVTGGGHRVGRAIALDLARNGWDVAVHYNRSAAAAEEVAAAIREEGGKAVALGADLGLEAEVAALVPVAVSALGPLGLLVNNASLFERDTALTATRESWDKHLEVNLRAPFVLTQEFARQSPADTNGVVRQSHRPAGLEPDPRFRLLYGEQGGAMDPHPEPRPGSGAENPRRRHRPRPGSAEHAAERRAVPASMAVHADAARRHALGDRRCGAVYRRHAFLHRADAGTGRRTASRLGAAGLDRGRDRVTGCISPCQLPGDRARGDCAQPGAAVAPLP